MSQDGLPVHVYKYVGEFTVDAMTDIIKSSMKNGDISDFLKQAWVTPIWMGKDSDDPINYRPISLTSHGIEIYSVLSEKRNVKALKHLNTTISVS